MTDYFHTAEVQLNSCTSELLSGGKPSCRKYVVSLSLSPIYLFRTPVCILRHTPYIYSYCCTSTLDMSQTSSRGTAVFQVQSTAVIRRPSYMIIIHVPPAVVAIKSERIMLARPPGRVPHNRSESNTQQEEFLFFCNMILCDYSSTSKFIFLLYDMYNDYNLLYTPYTSCTVYTAVCYVSRARSNFCMTGVRSESPWASAAAATAAQCCCLPSIFEYSEGGVGGRTKKERETQQPSSAFLIMLAGVMSSEPPIHLLAVRFIAIIRSVQSHEHHLLFFYLWGAHLDTTTSTSRVQT